MYLIRITDRTLSCLDDMLQDISALSLFLKYLIEMEADAIELSEKMYHLLAPLPEYPSYVLRVEQPADIAKYRNVSQFVCRNAPPGTDDRIRSEILLNDMRESYTIARYADCAKIRIQGLDDMLSGDYLMMFKNLEVNFHGNIEFSPSNRFHCAAALAAEWVMSGAGSDIVTSFGGVGGFAPTEELIMILRVKRLRKVRKTYDFFPQMANLLSEITAKKIYRNKPIIGKRIFHVESGIHVDGIIKQPKCYEPFSPKVVGQNRKIVLGKQSGAASIRAKLTEFGINCEEDILLDILEKVKTEGEAKNGALTNREFAEIVRRCMT